MPPTYLTRPDTSRRLFPLSRLEIDVTHTPDPYDVTCTPRHRNDVTDSAQKPHDVHYTLSSPRYDGRPIRASYDVTRTTRHYVDTPHDVRQLSQSYDVKARHNERPLLYSALSRHRMPEAQRSYRSHSYPGRDSQFLLPHGRRWLNDEYNDPISAKYDRRSYFSVGRKDGDADRARVRLYTHASPAPDPYASCTCFQSPRVSDQAIPSMQYDLARCRCHPHRRPLKQVKQNYFAYPWTVQTNRPSRYHKPQFGYRQGQIQPPSAVTAPPFATYNKNSNKKNKNNNNKNNKVHPRDNPRAPYSAPVPPPLHPLLSIKPTDRRLRRTHRRPRGEGGSTTNRPFLSTVLDEDVSPFDSVSQVAAPPVEDVSPFDSISQVSPARGAYQPPPPLLRMHDRKETTGKTKENDMDNDLKRAKARRLNTI